MKTKSVVIILVLAVLIVFLIYFLIAINNMPETEADLSTDNEEQIIVKVSSTSLGNIITDTSGMSLYIFQADTNGESTCYGTCASFWPPLLIGKGVKPVGNGVTALLGVTRRTDGTYQISANNMPLYYYAVDSVPGDVKGQESTGSGALWYVLSPSGEQITTSFDSENSISSSSLIDSQPGSSSASSSSGGYSY